MKILPNLRRAEWRVFGVVVVIVGLVATVYALRLPKWYQASRTMKYIGVGEDDGSQHACSGTEDWRGMVTAPNTTRIIQDMIQRFTDEERGRFLAPFHCTSGESQDEAIAQHIRENQRIAFDGLDRVILITYQHPDRLLAARVVNLIVDEIYGYSVRLRIDDALNQVEELVLRARKEEQQVRDLAAKLDAYRANRVQDAGSSLEQESDYQALKESRDKAQQQLEVINLRLRDASVVCRVSGVRWRGEDRTVPPDEGEYLLTPILVSLAWGWGIAVLSAAAAVGGMRFFRLRNSRAERLV